MIKTSIVIPVYNTAPYLKECIDSVLNQTQKEIEVIAVDGGSTDNSLEILHELQKRHPQLTVIHQENRGVGDARNTGMALATGEYIYFLDSDDYIAENALEICYACASGNNLDVVLFDSVTFWEDPSDAHKRVRVSPNPYDRHEIITEREEVFSGAYFLEKYYKKIYRASACLVYCSLRFLKQNHVKFLPNVYFEDHEFHCRIMTLADRVMYIPQMFNIGRCRKDSIMGSEFDIKRANDHLVVIRALADLRNLNNGKGWYVIKEIALNLLMYVAGVCGEKKFYTQDKQLSKRILETELKVFGKNIEDIEDMDEICHIFCLCENFLDADLCGDKKRIKNRYQQLLTVKFQSLPLKESSNRVVIYGCGEYTKKWMAAYKECIGDISAEVFFVETDVENEDKEYNGFPVKNVKSLENERIDMILISSSKYEQEMKDIISKYYKDRFLTVMLYGELNIKL